jgi:DNA-binding transcriptional MerR regulator
MTSAERLDHTLTITEVAQRIGLSIDTLRYYEKAGLIQPVARSTGRHRRYRAEDLDWIEFLLRLRATGMSIADMQRFATLRAHGPDTVEARLALLREHRRQLSVQINQLETNGQALDMKITHYEKLLEES